jgi:uncharacterized protein
MNNYCAVAMAIQKGEIELVKQQLKSIENINHVLESGDALIHYAVLAQNLDIVRLLIENACDLNIKDRYSGQTCLHYCGENVNLAMAKLLIKSGASLSVSDLYGNEPLWTAVCCFGMQHIENISERLEMIQYFLESDANINHQNKALISPINLARSIDHQPLLALFENQLI